MARFHFNSNVGSSATDRSVRLRPPFRRLLAILLTAASIGGTGFLFATPAQAAVACFGVVERAPFRNGSQVTASGYGFCSDWVEYIRVDEYLFRVRPDYTYALIGNRVATCGPVTLRCPRTSGAFAVSGARHAKCRYYYLRVDIDVMYKGIPAWYNNVDTTSSKLSWIC